MDTEEPKSLWDSTLEALEGLGLAVDKGETEGRLAADTGQTNLEAELEKSDKISKIDFGYWLSEQKVPIERRRVLELSAWLCENCSTLNGLDSKHRVRKTCLKCKRLRLDDRSYLEMKAEEFKL